MIDPTRWVIAEAWLSLGFRVQWIARWDYDHRKQDITEDPNTGMQFYYDGMKTWHIVPENPRRWVDERTSPSLSTDFMLHELAHWLSATREQRKLVNFGIDPDTVEGQAIEDRALEVQRALSTMLKACGRIASMALGARDV